MRRTTTILVALFVTIAPAAARAAKVDCYADPNTFEEAPLRAGDPAPRPPKAIWMNGEGPLEFQRGTVYLVEFWATWCQPCQKSIPHLNELQHAYRAQGLQVLGINAVENDGPEGLKSFLARTRIDYPIGYVDDEAIFKKWMWGARASGLPWVFLIDRQGRLLWWGQPFFEELETRVRQALAGDPLASRGETAQAARIARIKKAWALKPRAFHAYQSGRYDEALPLLDQMIAVDREVFWSEVVLKVRALMATDRARGLAFADSAAETLCRNNPQALTAIADSLVGAVNPSRAELAVAHRAAKQASVLTGATNADVERTLSSVGYLENK